MACVARVWRAVRHPPGMHRDGAGRLELHLRAIQAHRKVRLTRAIVAGPNGMDTLFAYTSAALSGRHRTLSLANLKLNLNGEP